MHRNRKLRITNYELGEIKAQIGSIVLRYLSLLKHKVFLLLIILFGAGITSVYAGSVFLSKSVNLSVQNVTLEQALHLIEERAGVQFMYNPRMLKSKRKVTLQKQASVQELLQQLINNSELVFYELNNVVVITSKRDAPKQVQVVSAAPAPAVVVVHKTVYDTVTISRTVTVYDTSRVIVMDTVRVYDTLKPAAKFLAARKDSKPEVSTSPSTDVISSVGIKNFFVTLEGGPQYSDLMPNYTWLSDMSLSGRAMIGCKWDNLFVSLGVGVLWQRGGSIGSKLTIYTDSTLMRDTIKVMQKYKVGEFWGSEGGVFVHKEIFDSVLVDVPRQWFNVRRREVKTDSTIGYRVTWVTIPCRIGGEWTFSRKTMMGISLCVSPAFSVLREGYVFDDKTTTYRTVKDFGLKSFAVFLAFEPSISYSLSKNLSIQIVPTVQVSAGSIFTKEAYYLSAGTFVGLRKLF